MENGEAPPLMSRAEPVARSADFQLEPPDGAWLRFSPDFLRIRFLNGVLEIVQMESVLRLDGEIRDFSWSASSQTVESAIQERLDDGLHIVKAELRTTNGSLLNIVWSFGLDTQVPELHLEPLPMVTTNSTVVIRGRASDPWLASLTIQGRDVVMDDGNFSVTVRLWPGLNDIVVEARDLAGNLRRLIRTIRLQTPAFNGSMVPWVLPEADFSIELPENWIAQQDIRLPSGNKADLVAMAPPQPGLQTTLIVVSRYTSLAYSRARALDWMNLVLAGVEVSGQLKLVISSPRLVEDLPGTVAVQATLLRQTAADRIAFMHITMVWSHLLRRQWVLLASTDISRAVETWPALEAAISSFTVLDQGLERPADDDNKFVVPTAIVLGAIAVILAISTVSMLPLYLKWRQRRTEWRWKPPRNWRL